MESVKRHYLTNQIVEPKLNIKHNAKKSLHNLKSSSLKISTDQCREIQDLVNQGLYLNPSEFIREALYYNFQQTQKDQNSILLRYEGPLKTNLITLKFPKQIYNFLNLQSDNNSKYIRTIIEDYLTKLSIINDIDSTNFQETEFKSTVSAFKIHANLLQKIYRYCELGYSKSVGEFVRTSARFYCIERLFDELYFKTFEESDYLQNYKNNQIFMFPIKISPKLRQILTYIVENNQEINTKTEIIRLSLRSNIQTFEVE